MYYNIHTHRSSNDNQIIDLLNIDIKAQNQLSHDKNYLSAGIHPWAVECEEELSYLKTLENSLKSNKNIIAVGEIGLDKVCNTRFEKQKELFCKQLKSAQDSAKVVIIHCVKAWDELLNITKEYPEIKFIIHNFQSSIELGLSLVKKGFYLSFGEKLIKNTKLQQVFKDIPLSFCFLETDNSTLNIKELYKVASELKNFQGIEEFALEIELNWKRVFGIRV